MRDYISLGSSPIEETCVQIGEPDYTRRSIQECNRFKDQLEKEFGTPPEKAYLSVKAFPHDFGTYHEVVCYYDDSDEESVQYCYNVEMNLPLDWKE